MQEIARILAFLLSIYYLLVIIRIFLTWIQLPQVQSGRGPVVELIYKIVDPYLHFFKRFVPVTIGRLDFSPLVALISLNIVQRLLQTYAYTGHMSVGYALALIVRSLWWSAGAYVVGILCIMLAIRLYLCFRRTEHSIQLIAVLDTWLNKILDMVLRYVFRGKETSNRNLVLASLLIMIALFILLSVIIGIATNLLANLPF
ncbi:MAG: YggT family protein [Sphaerochaetaceae bacterium]|jgi:YggT family protein|nr:YggT family protein [Sphaerochaetaceae bacterium]